MSMRNVQSKHVTAEQVQQMRQALEDIKGEEQEIILAEKAGLDMSAAKAALAESKAAAQQFLAVYGNIK